jgi:hypothetical protein
MSEDKAEKLKQALARLSARQATAVARGLETERVLGRERLPSEAILAALRPQLRHAGAKRVPTLRRLACSRFEDFLSDRRDVPRRPGLIPRSTIDPWWRALQHVAEAELRDFEAALKELVARDDEAGVAALGETVARAARGWTEGMLAALERRRPDAALKKLFPDPLLRADLQEIARVLPLGSAVRDGIDAVMRVASGHGEVRGARLIELGPETVTAAKLHYQRLSDAFGLDARYFALGLLNRLDPAWTILRLGRALSWKANDSMVRDTEFGIIGERLIADLQQQAQDIVTLAQGREATLKLAQLRAWLADYIGNAEGLLGEFGFRRDSLWGEAILKTRAEISRAVTANLPDIGEAALAVLPQAERARARRSLPMPDLTRTPDAGVTAAALDAARFLAFLMKHGARHGLGVATRETVEHIGEEIERRAGLLLEELRGAPQNRVIPQQLEAARQVADILFEDGRGDLLLRRLRNAQAAATPSGGAFGVMS